ncbi:hypothetical protein PLESTF_001322700 [Pleodorina starrii]|nr:hypothetical protein PLESTF_001322700 [Pleodorina starrii]
MPLPARLWEDCCTAQASCLRAGQQPGVQPAGQALQDPQGAPQPQLQHYHHHQQTDGRAALLGAGGVDRSCDDDDDEFDLMCVKAVEEFERRMTSHSGAG